jgi:GxxExxY protein
MEVLRIAGILRDGPLAARRVARELTVRVNYKGETIAHHRLDFVVDDRVVVELKATEVLAPHARAQLFNYLRATNLEVGLLLHFGPKPRVYRSLFRGRGIGTAPNA